MTRAKISEYDAVASNNTDVNGVNIAEGCPPSGMNNMGREIMAALKRFQVGSDGDGVTVGGNLVVSGSSTLSTTSISSADINAGTIDGTAIGGSTPAAGSFTTLNTSGAVVFNDAGADVDFRVEGDTNANLLFVDAGNDRVGIGTNTPVSKLQVVDGDITVTTNTSFSKFNATRTAVPSSVDIQLGRFDFSAYSTGTTYVAGTSIQSYSDASWSSTSAPSYLSFRTTASGSTSVTERMRIDSSGNVGIGTSTPNIYGLLAYKRITLSNSASSGYAILTAAGGAGAGGEVDFGNQTIRHAAIASLDGSSLGFYTNGTNSGTTITERMRIESGGNILPGTDNAQDLGSLTKRYDDVYATNGTIQTSDANEKQDIESLSEAETRVAVAAKGLLKKFRWKSAVAEKGDDARIHFGIIAQDLKAAFEAEGLDAGRYAMFIHSAWWEHEVEVPAVEAKEAIYETQTDEEGNEVQVLVSEAVEGKDAYTRTDTYETEEEAPEGAVRKERMGIRYNELLAFIIAAL